MRKYIFFIAIVIGLVYQFACEGPGSRPPAGFYRELNCTPDVAVREARQKLTDLNIGTTEATAEGKGLTVSTDSIVERDHNRERMGRYRLVIQPVGDANLSTVTLQRVEGKSKGVRERKWYDDDATSADAPSRERGWQQVKSICVANSNK
jgi:hypothetical protein